MSLAGTVVPYWSLMQEMAGSNPFTNIFVPEFAKFGETFREKQMEHDLKSLRRVMKYRSF